MRLLHSDTLQFREFFDRDVPKYAILSHRWGDEEVSFQEMEQNRVPDGPGIEKIRGCCRQARQDFLTWVWVDTCCIDKKSSAELSEAINSMFSWYERATICYVHLSDVTSSDEEEEFWQFKKSEWFTRGWTLQELLAPRHCLFFNAMWELLGTKEGLLSDLADITNIDKEVLDANEIRLHLKYASIAQRMSWAATRVTTKIEDEAYCLLGIFNIHMPLIYGEGARAFRRLQLEIIKESTDESIFAWGLGVGYSIRTTWPGTSVLATSTRDFVSCKHVKVQAGYTRTFSVTNLGLKIRVPVQALVPTTDQCDPSSFNMELYCTLRNQQDVEFHPIVLHLHYLNSSYQRGSCGSGDIYIGDSNAGQDPKLESTKVYLKI